MRWHKNELDPPCDFHISKQKNLSMSLWMLWIVNHFSYNDINLTYVFISASITLYWETICVVYFVGEFVIAVVKKRGSHVFITLILKCNTLIIELLFHIFVYGKNRSNSTKCDIDKKTRIYKKRNPQTKTEEFMIK